MKDVSTWIVVCGVLSALSASGTANANSISYPDPPLSTAGGEINAKVLNLQNVEISPADSPWPLVAAAMMGAKFYNPNVSVVGQEQALYVSCVSNSNAGNTWPGGCDLKGIANALAAKFPSQVWTYEAFPKGSDPQAAQKMAINRMIDGLSVYKSPALVPLYGKTDHWATVFEVKADKATTPYTLNSVKFFDSGSAGPNSSEPFTDSDSNFYGDGVWVLGGNAWKNTYYLLLFAPPGCAPYCDTYALSIEPPIGTKRREAAPRSELTFGRFPGVLLHDDEPMDALIAEERVWDALYVAEIFNDNAIGNAIASGRAGTAVPVYAENLDGEAMDYFLVPILDAQDELLAMVRLSMEDGAFEEIWIPTKPLPFLGVTPQEAEYFARQVISDDEMLIGGGLTWSARRSLGGSELLPYYEFQVLATSGESRGRIGVSHASGVVTGLDRSVARSARVTR